MNKLFLMMVLLSVSTAFAKEEKIIDVRDGKQKVYSPNDWMIVPRKPKRKKPVARKAPPVAVVKHECYPAREETKVVEKETLVYQKNHLRVLGGFGPTGTGLDVVPGSATLTSNYNPVFGLAYGRNWAPRWSVEGEALTNATFLLGVGYNF